MTLLDEQPTTTTDEPHCPTCTCGQQHARKNPVAPHPIDHGFDRFWSIYPRRRGMPKGRKDKTLEKWVRFNLADRILIYRATEKLASIVAAGITLPMDSQRFLTQGRDYWQDLLDSHPEVARPSHIPASAHRGADGGWYA